MLLSLLLVLIGSFVNGKDPSYPDIDYFAFRDATLAGLAQLNFLGLETPVIVHIAHTNTLNQWNCLAYFDSDKLDILTSQKPKINIPKKMHTTNMRTLCIVYSQGIATDFTFSPLHQPNGRQKVESVMKPIFESFGISDIKFDINEDVSKCNKDKTCLQNVAANYNYSPYIIASIIMDDIVEEFENDGWNMLGLEDINGDICEANCYPYSDTTGYKPKMHSKYNKYNKYNKYWQPLLETDHMGFFYRHEHVTPHIGMKAKKYLLDEYIMAEYPAYNYEKEANDLILRLKKLATDDFQKAAVELFDSKLLVRGVLWDTIQAKYGKLATVEIMLAFTMGISFAENEAILQAWNQKVLYDRVRPTTVIQRWGNKEIETYGGPFEGVKKIKAKYFEPYIRVMPHSEYPSGSACICTAYKEFTDLFIKEYFGDNSLYDMNVAILKGSSKIEPGMTPKEDLIIHMKDMSELAYLCGESRLWGGMHFRKSVSEANRICSGLGLKAFQLLQNAQNL